jgi:Skp family chaperone for outer membrane proteins
VKSKSLFILAAFAAALVSACAKPSPIGLVDVGRIIANWPEYQTDQMHLLADERTIASSKASAASKERQALGLQRKYTKITDQLTQQIRDAAAKIAQQRRLQLVLTREGVGYGGVDITAEVEKALNITEKATPSPRT